MNFNMAKQANAAMTDEPVVGKLKDLKRGGREDRRQPNFDDMMAKIKKTNN